MLLRISSRIRTRSTSCVAWQNQRRSGHRAQERKGLILFTFNRELQSWIFDTTVEYD